MASYLSSTSIPSGTTTAPANAGAARPDTPSLHSAISPAVARPGDEAIRRSLASLLSSPQFARSERLRAFLAYVVEREIEGQGPQLKGYTIGIDVFGRSHAFNADSDPLVRVHAGKLRKLLDVYYAEQGARDEWRIDIPKGTYVPEYRRWSVTQTDTAANLVDTDAPAMGQSGRDIAEQASRARGRQRPSWLPKPLSSPVAMLSLLPLLLFALLASPALSVNLVSQSWLNATALDRVVARELPRVIVEANGPPRGSKAGRLADALRSAALHYRTVFTASQNVLWRTSDEQSQLAFRIVVSQQSAPAGVAIALLGTAAAAPLYEKFIDEADLDGEADILYESLAFASAALSIDGAIFRDVLDRQVETTLMRCMVLTDSYRRDQSRDSFHQAKSCQDDLSVEHRSKLNFVISANALPATIRR